MPRVLLVDRHGIGAAIALVLSKMEGVEVVELKASPIDPDVPAFAFDKKVHPKHEYRELNRRRRRR